VVRHSADASSNFSGAYPTFGSTKKELTYLGMGFHIGQAWTLFFNLLGAITTPARTLPCGVFSTT
jgi:hypothetical protein